MMKFEPLIPENLEACLDMLASHAGEARVVAGGTDLFILAKARMMTPKFVIPIGHIDRLKQASAEGGTVRLGAGLSHSMVARLDILKSVACLRVPFGVSS